MANSKLQILIHASGIGNGKLSLSPYPGVSLVDIKKVSSPNYLFAYINISPEAKPGALNFTLTEGGKSIKLAYQLKARDSAPKAQGYTPADVVYLIMPDRFANGDPKNDAVKGMLEPPDRKADFGRHGGDLKGITQNLDYFKKLGVTTLWINPVQENDMPQSSYHGYAITDYYGVDRRFGGLPAHMEMVSQSHAKGLKVVMDMVMNHIGTNHYWIKDLPDSNWINQWPTYTPSNYRASVVADPYAAAYDVKKMAGGWFDKTMADLNQRHPLLADYLIQNCIWWIEHTHIDAIRMDTYPYPDKLFMNRWSAEIMTQYPNFKLVGEVWVTTPGLASYYTRTGHAYQGFSATLPTITDFPVRDGIVNGLNEDGGWDSGLAKLYNILGQDYLYENAGNNLIFADNHDLTRMGTALKADPAKVRQALTLLLTLRGIPQLYYGAEWMMLGDGAYHPAVRRDFKGGWAGDSSSFLTGTNLSKIEKETYAYFNKLIKWRKTAKAVHEGNFTHYVPDDNVYVYFRHGTGLKQVMVIINGDNKAKTLDLTRFAEHIKASAQGTDVATGSSFDLRKTILLESQAALILDLN